jgi:hypothetical protein
MRILLYRFLLRLDSGNFLGLGVGNSAVGLYEKELFGRRGSKALWVLCGQRCRVDDIGGSWKNTYPGFDK